jgi:RNA polymerase sigma-54 factor
LIKENNLDTKRIDKILTLIQTFEPEGVGARNLKECLLIQLKQFALDEEVEEKLAIIIRKNLQEIAKKDFSKIAKILNLTEEAVKAMAGFISEHLNPNPGGGFGSETQEFIIPSFSWEGNGKEAKISNLETSKGPNLTLSHYYLNILENPQTDNNTLKFLKEKLEKAKIFLKDIVKRQQTLEQIVQKVCESQVAFLNGEKHFLTPILQKDLAQNFNLHTSYVSRALSGKYIQTPRGIFPLKYLCSRSNRGRSISEIMFAVKNIIEKENKKKPLTDTQVQKELEKQGFFLARRTVAKYRSKAGLSTKGKRK